MHPGMASPNMLNIHHSGKQIPSNVNMMPMAFSCGDSRMNNMDLKSPSPRQVESIQQDPLEESSVNGGGRGGSRGGSISQEHNKGSRQAENAIKQARYEEFFNDIQNKSHEKAYNVNPSRCQQILSYQEELFDENNNDEKNNA